MTDDYKCHGLSQNKRVISQLLWFRNPDLGESHLAEVKVPPGGSGPLPKLYRLLTELEGRSEAPQLLEAPPVSQHMALSTHLWAGWPLFRVN